MMHSKQEPIIQERKLKGKKKEIALYIYIYMRFILYFEVLLQFACKLSSWRAHQMKIKLRQIHTR